MLNSICRLLSTMGLCVPRAWSFSFKYTLWRNEVIYYILLQYHNPKQVCHFFLLSRVYIVWESFSPALRVLWMMVLQTPTRPSLSFCTEWLPERLPFHCSELRPAGSWEHSKLCSPFSYNWTVVYWCTVSAAVGGILGSKWTVMCEADVSEAGKMGKCKDLRDSNKAQVLCIDVHGRWSGSQSSLILVYRSTFCWKIWCWLWLTGVRTVLSVASNEQKVFIVHPEVNTNESHRMVIHSLEVKTLQGTNIYQVDWSKVLTNLPSAVHIVALLKWSWTKQLFWMFQGANPVNLHKTYPVSTFDTPGFIWAKRPNPHCLKWQAMGSSNKTVVSLHKDLPALQLFQTVDRFCGLVSQRLLCRTEFDRWPLTPCGRCFLPRKQVQTHSHNTHFIITAHTCVHMTHSHACTQTQTLCVHPFTMGLIRSKCVKCCSDR